MMLRVLVAIVVLAFACAQAEAKRVALVIGNSKYATVGELFTPKRDVPLIEKALRESGFDDVDVRMDLGLHDLTTALRDFSDKASNAEMALVYFAGHGVEINKTNYLVPIDAKLRKAKDAGYEAVDLALVRNAVSGASKLRMVVLDACRNNPFPLETKDGSKSLRKIGLGKVDAGVNELIAFSAQQGVVADDGPRNGNSPFAVALAKWLVEPGMEIRFVMGHVRDEVLNSTGTTEEREGPQIPYIEGSLGGEQIVFKPTAAEPVKVPTPNLTVMEPNPSVTVESIMKKIWTKYPEANIKMSDSSFAEALGVGINFASKFTLVNWSCGTYCGYGFVVDRTNGKLIDLPLSGGGGYVYRKDNALLIVDPDPSDFYGFDLSSDGTKAPDWYSRRVWMLREDDFRLVYQDKGGHRDNNSDVIFEQMLFDGNAWEEWSLAQNSNNREVLEEFKRKYNSDPLYRGLAEEKLALLAPTKPVEPKCLGVSTVVQGKKRCLNHLDQFTDCEGCPEMVVMSAGSFMMGSPIGEKDRQEDEGPQHNVTFEKSFAVGKFEITRSQFAEFARTTNYSSVSSCRIWDGSEWKDTVGKSFLEPGFKQTVDHAVACVSWDDAQAFVKWLSKKTGVGYRLLREAEWEYAARAGTTAAYQTGEAITTAQANFAGSEGGTVVVGSYSSNLFGLFDMAGNVREWTADCYEDSYKNADAIGKTTKGSSCRRTNRGGGWNSDSRFLRSASRNGATTVTRYSNLGFRIARSL